MHTQNISKICPKVKKSARRATKAGAKPLDFYLTTYFDQEMKGTLLKKKIVEKD